MSNIVVTLVITIHYRQFVSDVQSPKTLLLPNIVATSSEPPLRLALQVVHGCLNFYSLAVFKWEKRTILCR